MGAVDEFLPKAFLDATQVLLNMCGAIVVTAAVNPMFLIPLVVMSIIFVFIRKVYLKTSKNIKRLEGICKSSPDKENISIYSSINKLSSQQNRQSSHISRQRWVDYRRSVRSAPSKH